MSTSIEQTLIVIPAFNEEETIGLTLDEIATSLPGAHCLVVNDGSIDKTAEVAKQHGALVATFPFNMGVGAAMRFGYRYAVANSYLKVVQLDADGQHNPIYVPQLLERLSSSDIVIGARFAGEGSYAVSGPRKWAMQMLSLVISSTAKTKLTDTTSGFRATGRRATAFFALDYPAEYLGDTVESLVSALRSGLTVQQVPVAMRPRMGGTPSHNGWKSAVFLFRAIAALAVAYVRPTEPFEPPNA